jgi:ketosteroid isomerase-like protein
MTPAADSTSEISEAGRRFLRLFAQNDVPGIGACYTEDAQMLAANMKPIQGRAAIEAVFKFTGGQGHTLEFKTHELELHGTTAIEIGAYVRTGADGSNVDQGKYIVIWKRTGSEWKIHRDMFNTNRPRATHT